MDAPTKDGSGRSKSGAVLYVSITVMGLALYVLAAPIIYALFCENGNIPRWVGNMYYPLFAVLRIIPAMREGYEHGYFWRVFDEVMLGLGKEP